MASFAVNTDGLPSTLAYPCARRDLSVVDDYHGTRIPDPYRWLEDGDAEEVKEFVEGQGKVTEEVMAACAEERDRLREKITEIFDHPRYGTPIRRGERYFYLHNTGLQGQSVLYVLQPEGGGILLMKGEGEGEGEGAAAVLLDPNELSKDGTVALAGFAVSEDGKYLAYGLSEKGSDWVTIRTMRVDDREVLPDTISWVKFSAISWTHDGKGFFYSRFPSPSLRGKSDVGLETSININHEVYYHFLGTEQSEDILCWRDPKHPKYIYEARVTEDGNYCLLYIEEGCNPANKLYYCELSSLPQGLEGFRGSQGGNLPFKKVVDNFEGRYLYVANDGPNFTLLTNKDAPKSKLIRTNLLLLADDDPEACGTDLLRESDEGILEMARAVNGDQLLVSYISDVKHVLQLRDLRTGRLLHRLPIDIGSVFGITGSRNSSEAFFGFTSFLTPGIIYRCDLATTRIPQIKIFRESAIRGFRRSDFQVKQEFTRPSRDGGTRIPMFIFSKKGIPLNGAHPTLLYGYGGFGCSLTPSFNVHRVALVKHLGAVCCIASIRGGGEYGEEWHRAGSLSNKQNCFDDFISAAQHLVSSGYTNPTKLCIEGRSNGGLLVAACINQRPDLFGCALAHVGVMDMLRFHKFTIGHAWTSEFGCSDKEEEFQWLIKYSPLHNVKRPWEEGYPPCCQYPSTMLLTADYDDRVVPLHSLKLLATMQYTLCTSLEYSPQTNPIVARIDTKSGHGAGRSTQKMIDEAADRYGFMAKMLGATWIS